MAKVEKLDTIPEKNRTLPVKVTEMGNVIEVQYMSHRNNKQTIQMLPGKEEFMILSTGEVKEISHGITRKDNKKSLYRTFANARAVINSNVTDVSKVRWCTLTYAENMTDTVQLYDDFLKFNKRFQYYCKKHDYGCPEYIVMMEPQGRGAWHAHLLYIWEDRKAPFIPNSDFAELWGHGFVKIKKLDNVDNVGAYLTAYLGDMELDNLGSLSDSDNVKFADVVDDDGKVTRKAFVKGARLDLYPMGFKLLRCSRGVNRPTENMLTQLEAEEKVLGATKTFESALKLTDDQSDFETIIIKEQYNRIRGKNQLKSVTQ